ncbi:unnamed protein product [Amoebophrya sp. A25]|nr:unnamed protein product [Amoebophrya sp. A25]|eukprot:GSA25T00003431001.1
MGRRGGGRHKDGRYNNMHPQRDQQRGRQHSPRQRSQRTSSQQPQQERQAQPFSLRKHQNSESKKSRSERREKRNVRKNEKKSDELKRLRLSETRRQLYSLREETLRQAMITANTSNAGAGNGVVLHLPRQGGPGSCTSSSKTTSTKTTSTTSSLPSASSSPSASSATSSPDVVQPLPEEVFDLRLTREDFLSDSSRLKKIGDATPTLRPFLQSLRQKCADYAAENKRDAQTQAAIFALRCKDGKYLWIRTHLI